jgi:hypothetical protein
MPGRVCIFASPSSMAWRRSRSESSACRRII